MLPTSPAQLPPTSLQLPIQPPTPDNEEDMPTEEFFFYGNGQTGENPQDFIKRFESKDLKDTMMEEKKTAAFYNRFKSGKTAEEWYDSLPAVDTASWAAVKMVFQACWLKKTTSLKLASDKSNFLKGHILKEEELGKWEDDDGRDELSHVIWANKILTLANDVPDPAGLLIPEVCHLLPDIIKEQIESEFTTWDRFENMIKAISKLSIDDALAKEKKYCLVMEESQATTAAAHTAVLQQSPTAPLCHMLQNTAILQYPQAPLPQPQFNQPPPSPSPQQPIPTSRGQMPGQAPFAFCSNELWAADACANALPQHKCGWHAVAAIVFGVIWSHKPVPVCYVDYTSTPQYAPRQPWYPQESHYTQPKQPYHEYQTQGKGEGLSTQ